MQKKQLKYFFTSSLKISGIYWYPLVTTGNPWKPTCFPSQPKEAAESVRHWPNFSLSANIPGIGSHQNQLVKCSSNEIRFFSNEMRLFSIDYIQFKYNFCWSFFEFDKAIFMSTLNIFELGFDRKNVWITTKFNPGKTA